MKKFTAENGETWVAGAAREDTDRHHGVWYLVFQKDGSPGERLPVEEVRWQTQATADRTLRTMSDFELRRRLNSAIARYEHSTGPTAAEGEHKAPRQATNINAG
jgi:hypothetical protein